MRVAKAFVAVGFIEVGSPYVMVLEVGRLSIMLKSLVSGCFQRYGARPAAACGKVLEKYFAEGVVGFW